MAAIVAQHEPNQWVRRAVVGWSLFLGAFGAWGWLTSLDWSPAAWMNAGVSAASCVMLLNASAQMRRAWAKRRTPATVLWALATVAFGAWSGVSAHHAFEVAQKSVQADAMGSYSAFAMVFFIFTSWLDPLLMWGVEDVERAPEPRRSDQPDQPVNRPWSPTIVHGGRSTGRAKTQPVNRAGDSSTDRAGEISTVRPTGSTAQPVARLTQPVERLAQPTGSTDRATGSTVLGGATAASTVALLGVGAAGDIQPASIVEPVGGVWASPEAHAVALLATGVSEVKTAQATGLTRHKIRQLKAVQPGGRQPVERATA